MKKETTLLLNKNQMHSVTTIFKRKFYSESFWKVIDKNGDECFLIDSESKLLWPVKLKDSGSYDNSN